MQFVAEERKCSLQFLIMFMVFPHHFGELRISDESDAKIAIFRRNLRQSLVIPQKKKGAKNISGKSVEIAGSSKFVAWLEKDVCGLCQREGRHGRSGRPAGRPAAGGRRRRGRGSGRVSVLPLPAELSNEVLVMIAIRAGRRSEKMPLCRLDSYKL